MYSLAGIAGVATSPVAYSRVVANWFDRRRGLALGLSSAGVGVGAFIMPSLAHFLIEEYGWRQAYTALGCASLLIGAPWWRCFSGEARKRLAFHRTASRKRGRTIFEPGTPPV